MQKKQRVILWNRKWMINGRGPRAKAASRAPAFLLYRKLLINGRGQSTYDFSKAARYRQRALPAFLSVVVLIALLTAAYMPQSVHAATVNIAAAGAFVMDFESGDELYSVDPDKARVPASMTKVMSLYLIYEALATGWIRYDQAVPISTKAHNMSLNPEYGTVIPLEYGQAYTVSQLLDIIIVASSSASVMAMAELIGGSEAAFVTRMNNKAKAFSLNASYYDCVGLANNYISPRSMAALARRLILDYPEVLTRSSQASVMFYGKRYSTTNRLLDTYYYEGADGLKTGTTSAAGYCFCGTAKRGDIRLISVVMYSSSTTQRFVDTQRLLDYGFSVMQQRKVVEYTDANDIAWELGNRGIVSDTAGLVYEMQQNQGGRLYWLARKSVHYMRTHESAPVRQVSEYTDANDIVWELGYRGVVGDTAGLLHEMEQNQGGRLYWLARKSMQYMRER